MARVLVLNKPFDVLCKFTDADGRATLADHVSVPDVYPCGRLDRDSEGLVVLTDDGQLQHQLAHPSFEKEKGYWAQVEGEISEAALASLRAGVLVKGHLTRPAKAQAIPEPPGLWPRQPPIRVRQAIPTSWLDLRITEGMNRQVRRMTAAVGFPTLRLVRYQVGPWCLDALQPGEWRDERAPALLSPRRTRPKRRR